MRDSSPIPQRQRSNLTKKSNDKRKVRSTERDPLIVRSNSNDNSNNDNNTSNRRKIRDLLGGDPDEEDYEALVTTAVTLTTTSSNNSTRRRRSPLSLPQNNNNSNEMVNVYDAPDGSSSPPNRVLDDNDNDSTASSRPHERLDLYAFRQEYYEEHPHPNLPPSEHSSHTSYSGIPEEVYAVRKSALTVMEPLVPSWMIFSAGISLSTLLAMSKGTKLLPKMYYWVIFLPTWIAHLAMLVCHVKSARALAKFIADANNVRQRPHSTDHIDRAEYLPLLHRALKFGIQTVLFSMGAFVTEILLYLFFIHPKPTLGTALLPVWILIVGGILQGLLCKTQNSVRVICWLLALAGTMLLVSKVDSLNELQWRLVFSPFLALFSIITIFLIYLIYGHQVGYFRLTESQLTASILYSASSVITIVWMVVVAEVLVQHSFASVDSFVKLFLTTLAPLVVALVGLGAWAVSKDDFHRLLLYGGQTPVFPMKLRFEPNRGWTSVESKGLANIPMLGEVHYQPLDPDRSQSVEMCVCCTCYPYEDDDDEHQQHNNEYEHTPRRSNSNPHRESLV